MPLRLTVFMRRIEGRREPEWKWRIVDLTPGPVSVRDGFRRLPLETPGIYRRYPFDIKGTRTIRRNRCQTAGTAVLSLAILSPILSDRPIAFRSLPVLFFPRRPSPIWLDGGAAREHAVFSKRSFSLPPERTWSERGSRSERRVAVSFNSSMPPASQSRPANNLHPHRAPFETARALRRFRRRLLHFGAFRVPARASRPSPRMAVRIQRSGSILDSIEEESADARPAPAPGVNRHDSIGQGPASRPRRAGRSGQAS